MIKQGKENNEMMLKEEEKDEEVENEIDEKGREIV